MDSSGGTRDSCIRHSDVVLFGGSFDPPHLGHLAIIEALSELYGKVIVIPAFCNPLKSMPMAMIHTRIQWLQELCAMYANVEISDFEAQMQRIVYAIEYVRHYASKYDDIAMALGSDALLSLSRWMDSSELARLARILPIIRESKVGYATDQRECALAREIPLGPLESSLAQSIDPARVLESSINVSALDLTHALDLTRHRDSKETDSKEAGDTISEWLSRHIDTVYNDRGYTRAVDSILWRFAPALRIIGFPISSTQIRTALAQGEFDQVSRWIPRSIATCVQKIYYNTH